MTDGDFRVFVSAVSSEFGKVRSAVASDLRSRGLSVKVQEDFRLEAGADTLLRKLHNYIHNCSAVVCIIGDRSGAGPTQIEALPFLQLLPQGVTQASYTQWEFFLARHFRRNLYLYLAKNYNPDRPASGTDNSNLQQAYVRHIQGLGLDRQSFATDDELGRKILREDWTNSKRPKPIVLPYPSIGDLFKGRDEFLRGLNDSLQRHGHTAIVSHAFYGLGGIGKTRAAVEFAWAHRDSYSALLFVVAETPEALRRNLAALASTLVPGLETTDDAERLQAVLDWLQANPGWFLILDNVDAKPALAEVERIMGALSGGHVVVTSRLADFSGNFQPLELGVLALADATAFLLARTDNRRRVSPDDDVKAREVATELGQLALALEQAAAFIAKRKLTFDQYQEQWRSRRDEVLTWFDTTVTGYPRAVAVTWQTSVAQLSEGGRCLLERLAWLAPEKVPDFLLRVPIPGAEAEQLHDALDDLAAYSLVTRDAADPYFLIHRLVQDVTRRSLTGEVRHQRLVETLNWIGAAFIADPEDVRAWPALDPISPHARAVTGYADAAGIAERTSWLMNQLGILLTKKALHAEAEPFMRRSLSIAEKRFGPNHSEVASRLNNLAALFQSTNRLAEAEPLTRRALAIDETSLGPNHPKVASGLNNLAQLLNATNRLAEAEPLMRRTLAIDEKNFGSHHPDVATDLNNLARLLHVTNRHDEAEPLFRRALAIYENSFGPHDPRVAMGLNNLSLLLLDTNRLAEAEPLIRRALAIDEQSFGPNHPKVAIRLSNIGSLLYAINRYSEAEPLIRRALAIDEESLGSNHPDVAVDLNNLAQLLQTTDRLAEAEPLFRRQIAILLDFTRKTGYRHPHLEHAFQNYGGLLAEMGNSPAEIEVAISALMQPISPDVSA
jgi:tetratricopeptide (TPR) repeat protein